MESGLMPRERKWRRRFLIEDFGEFFSFCLTVESSLLLQMRSFGGPGGRACPVPSRRVEESKIAKSPPSRSQIRPPPAWHGLLCFASLCSASQSRPAGVSPSVTATPHVVARKPALSAVERVAISPRHSEHTGCVIIAKIHQNRNDDLRFLI